MELTCVLALLAGLAGLCILAYREYHVRANRALCHANQQLLQKKIDSLGLSNHDLPIEAVILRMIESGLLDGKIDTKADGSRFMNDLSLIDPGFGIGSYRHYRITAGSLRVGCSEHGMSGAQ